ncbi:3-hydroxyacyl-ACP dehydratase FabZ family protein [Cellvibrio sp. OA-2007]|uniref:3-hydroxyacyl-ACP dehydratase FabZ family protein n=1 Tax=Cellvibrio sp. OA-2007 TaxID=529823 RepID=UPI0007817DD4|nr:3-hydroxyacyl-ACP dehydratase FabZ family protein [Cellvibrio sp. OA-2007]
MDFPAISSLIPHRDPMLLVDSIKTYSAGEGLTTVTAVSDDAFWVRGHFPGNPVMPGVLITETLAQTCAAFMAMESQDNPATVAQVYLLLRTDMRFIKPVAPGMVMECQIMREEQSDAFDVFRVRATVNGECCARGKLTVACRPQQGVAAI